MRWDPKTLFWRRHVKAIECVLAFVRHVWRVFRISSCDMLCSRRIQRDWQLRSYASVPSFSFLPFHFFSEVRKLSGAWCSSAVSLFFLRLSFVSAWMCDWNSVRTSNHPSTTGTFLCFGKAMKETVVFFFVSFYLPTIFENRVLRLMQ